MPKVVYNACYGGFCLSEEAAKTLNELKGEEVCPPEWGYVTLPRHDKDLVKVVEFLGTERASGKYADLRVTTVENKYRVCEYDGTEWVETPDTIDWIEAR